jgi:hypothetical protein
MRRYIRAIPALAVLLLTGCTTITVPYMATGNPVGDKVGESTAAFLFGWIHNDRYLHHSDVTNNNFNGFAGDITGTRFFGPLIPLGGRFTFSAAAAKGGITRIATVEIRTENRCGLFVKRTLIVTGD